MAVWFGMHPAEIVFTLLFVWATLLFYAVMRQKAERGAMQPKYVFFLVGLILWTFAALLDVLDSLPVSGIRILDVCEHFVFLIGAIFFVIAVRKNHIEFERMVSGT
ncbi:MAG: hypothetical protein QMC77_08825 [Methanocellales archaeon]|nr:hypothetical protein [Methanocellales archaeon]